MPNNYKVHQKWLLITEWIMDRCEKFPKHSRFTISNRIINHVLDVGELIVEAIYAKSRLHILKRINLYIEKIRMLIRISFNKKYISTKQYEYVNEEINEFGKMIGGWIKHQNYEKNS